MTDISISARKATKKEEHFTQTPNNHDDYELRDEYDLSEMRIVAKGRYAPHRRTGKNVVLLDPDVTEFFPTDESVNEALRLIMKAAEIPFRHGKELKPV